jgi:carbamoyl-phosphate synthase large subunit
MTENNLHIAVTGLHAADNPAPGIGVVRSLRANKGWNGTIIGLAYDVYDTGIYDPALFDSTFLVPYPNQVMEDVFQRLLYIHEQVKIDVLIPTLDSELKLYRKLEPRLREVGIRMFIPNEEMEEARTKANLVEFCEKNDIPTPKTFVLRDPSKLKDALDEVGLPCFVKGVFYDAHECHTHDEALQAMEKLRAMWGMPVLIQESLTGEEFDICVLADHGRLIGALPIRKTRMTDKGKAWAAVSIRNAQMLEMSEKIISALGWSGPCELEIMQDAKTKELYLIEINPRFPAWIFLGTGAEQNMPPLLVDLALGKEVEPLPPAKSGVSFVRHATDLVCPLEFLESLTVHGELRHRVDGDS